MKTKLLYLLLIICSYSYAQNISTNNIRAKYTFDNGAVLDDSSVTGNDFTQTGTALTQITDRFNNSPTSAVSLNGDYLTRSDISFSGTSNFNISFSFWLKTSTNTGDKKTIIDDSTRNTVEGFDSNDRGYYIFYRDGKINLSSRFQVTNPGFNPSTISYGHEHPTVIADGKWHHIVVEFTAVHNYQGQKVNSKIYIDKVVNSNTLTTSPITLTPNTGSNVTIANSRFNHLSAINRYSDAIDDIIVYDRKFTTAEVAVLANHNNYCFTPSTSIVTIPTITSTTATVAITNNGNTYDIAYHKASDPFSNATMITGLTTGSTNLTGLDLGTNYIVYVREQCTNLTDWSSSVAFATTRLSTTLYVNKNATGANDGTSWANAYTGLQDALTNTISDDEIWIAGGTYLPHASDRNTYFVIDKENLKIYGGFAGTETQISDRVFGSNETILSGDLQDNDANVTDYISNYNNATRNADNSYHLIDIIATGNNLLLDGLTISDAHNNLNSTEQGGAIVKEKTIAKLALKNCIIKDNLSRNDNAGIYAEFDLNNVSGTRGVFKVENSQFINNMSRWGSGIYSYARGNTNVDITVANSLFDGNIAGNLNSSTAKGISGSAAWFRMLGNTSDMTLNFTNNTLVNNIDNGTLNVTSSTHAVLAISKSSGVSGTFNAEASNNIFWNNKTLSNAVTRSITDLYKLPITSLKVYNSIDENVTIDNSITSTANIINSNPLFTSTTDFTLQSNSPAINTGDNTKVPSGITTDLLGNQRIFNTTVDMGAYENAVLTQRTLTINASNGTVTTNPNPVNGTYDDGTVVGLSATPNAGYQFDGWSGDASGTTNPLNMTMDADKTVTATFSKIQRTLTINSTNGNVNVSGAFNSKSQSVVTGYLFYQGDVATLTPVPAAGYQFDGWSGDGSGTTKPLNLTMDADKTVTAIFSLIVTVQRTLTINASNGTVTTNPNPVNGTYDDGTVVGLSATPNAGYQFDGWSGDASGTTNPLNMTMDADKTVTATFSKIQRTLTINSTNGNVNVSGAFNSKSQSVVTGYLFYQGDVATLTPVPAAGYQFDGWSGDASGTTNPLSITMDADKTVTATFSLIPIVQRILTINATNGTVTTNPNPTNGTYADGTVVGLTATPATGYQFDGWSGDASGTTNPLNITMDADKTVTATFSKIQRTLTINSTNGNVNVSGAFNSKSQSVVTGYLFYQGDVATLTPVPAAGYQFDGWSGDASGTTNPLNITMDADKTVTATFSLIPIVQRTLTINATNGTVTTNPNAINGTYADGTVVGLTATPSAGYQFDGWSGDASGTTNPLNITMDADKTVTATFSLIPIVQRTLTINATNGTVITNPNATKGTYANGTVVGLTATPSAGYQFDGWSGDASGTTNPLSITMDADKTVTATFSLIPIVQRTLTINATNGTVTTNPNATNGTYADGTVVGLTATPSVGYQFDGWSGAASGTTNPLNITMEADKTVTATFSLIPIVQRTLTINATNGTVTTNPNATNGTYADGTVVGLTATPSAGYQFDGWSGDAVGATNPLNITMDADKTVTATFSLIPIVQRTLTINATNGTVTTNPNATNGTYADGTVVGLTATPSVGYQFDGWSGDAVGATNPLNITMDADKTVTATFSLIPIVQYTLTINVVGNGTVIPVSGNVYNDGDMVTVTATAATNHMVKEWTGDVIAGTINSVEVTMSKDKTITIEFVEDIKVMKNKYGFSPNGDGVNDGWVIENIQLYPNNVVRVYNRSGKVVFEQKGYDNTWQGFSNKTTSGKKLPVGAYYFTVEFNTPGAKPAKGWIYINY